jgi:CCR4-NOT transcriptional regulation complex NOT5 subunit
MKKEKVYILQKDLPDSKAGDQYILVSGDFRRYYKNGDMEESYWMAENVEGNHEWFKEKEEQKPTVSDFREDEQRFYFNVYEEWMIIKKERLAEILIEEQLKTNK